MGLSKPQSHVPGSPPGKHYVSTLLLVLQHSMAVWPVTSAPHQKNGNSFIHHGAIFPHLGISHMFSDVCIEFLLKV